MMSKEYQLLNEIIETISTSTGLDEGQIAISVGRNAGYISQLRSRHKSKGADIPEKFLHLLKLQYANLFETENTGGKNPISTSYTEKRLRQKINGDAELDGIVFISISAQAGYVKHIMDSGPMKHEKIFIPGFPYRGDQYRYFEVAGDSMLPTLEEGFYVLTESVEQGQWSQQADYYTYVIVTKDQIMIKRIYKKSAEEWVIISDNEEFYPQFLLKVTDIKELWKVKRKIDWKISPPKKFEIKI